VDHIYNVGAHNFYTSLPLANNLLQADTHLVGTLRANRKGIPKEITTARLKRGEVFGRENESGIVIMKWRDKRDVLVLSTRHTDALENTGKKNRHGDNVVKPKAIVYYNQAKQGSDISDPLSSYQSTLRKSIRWYHKVVMELLMGTAVVNALIQHNDYRREVLGDTPLPIVAFRERIVTQLLNYGNSTPYDHQAHVVTSTHHLRETEEREHGKRTDRRKRRYCVECYSTYTETYGRDIAKKKAKRVTTECAACPGNPRLCFACFPKFHAIAEPAIAEPDDDAESDEDVESNEPE